MTNEFTLPGAEPSYAPDLALEPVHIALSLNVDIEAKRIAGRATTSVRANRVGTRTLILNAVGFVAAEVSGPLSSRYDGRQLTITWDTPFAEGETREVRDALFASGRPLPRPSGICLQRPRD
jgi:aminopeptidase N